MDAKTKVAIRCKFSIFSFHLQVFVTFFAFGWLLSLSNLFTLPDAVRQVAAQSLGIFPRSHRKSRVIFGVFANCCYLCTSTYYHEPCLAKKFISPAVPSSKNLWAPASSFCSATTSRLATIPPIVTTPYARTPRFSTILVRSANSGCIVA